MKLIKLLFHFLIRRLEKALEKECKPFSRGMNSAPDPPNSPLECPLGWIGTVRGLKHHFSLNCLVPPSLQQRIPFCLFPVIITHPFVQDSTFLVWVLTSLVFVCCYPCCHSPPFSLLVQPCFHSSRCGTAGTFSLLLFPGNKVPSYGVLCRPTLLGIVVAMYVCVEVHVSFEVYL